MKLDENYHIEKDEHSWNLVYVYKYISKKGKNKGKEVESKNNWYFPTLTACLMGYVSQKVDPNNKTVADVLAKLDQIKQTIINTLNSKV
jgi:hypothetical protein